VKHTRRQQAWDEAKRAFEGQRRGRKGRRRGSGGDVYDGGKACDGGKGVGISGVVVSIRPAYMSTRNSVDANIVEVRASHSGLDSSQSHIE